jgi:oxaloacetate decarboxylase alpha subunit
MTHINTAIPPLADGSSNPSLFNVAMNARSLGFKIMINEKPLRAVADHFTACAKRDNLPIGKPPEYDYAQYVHQIPGGMISNLRHQLQLVGERYKQVTDQTIEYAMGIWGKEGAEFMDPNVKEKILNRPRAKEIAARPHPTDSLTDLRRKYGGTGVSDEDVLLHFFSSKEDVERMRAAGPARAYTSLRNPILNLVETLSKKSDRHRVFIQSRDFSLRMERRREV